MAKRKASQGEEKKREKGSGAEITVANSWVWHHNRAVGSTSCKGLSLSTRVRRAKPPLSSTHVCWCNENVTSFLIPTFSSFLLQVDESLLSSDGGSATHAGGLRNVNRGCGAITGGGAVTTMASSHHQQHPLLPVASTSSSASANNNNPSYPWVQMALPGGGIVSVPLEPRMNSPNSSIDSSNAAAASASTAGGGGGGSGLGGHQLISAVSVPPPPPPPPSVAAQGQGGTGGQQGDLLTVSAGEPVTHFNLDQLLEIVQSFQLDTSLAGHEGVAPVDVNLAALAAAASASANSATASAGSAGRAQSPIIKVQKRMPCPVVRGFIIRELVIRALDACPSV